MRSAADPAPGSIGRGGRRRVAIAIAFVVASGCSAGGGPVAPSHPLCVGGGSADGVYPKAEYSMVLGATLPDLELDSTDAAGRSATVALHDYFEPCAAQSRLLVVRVSAAWCGTCRWHVAHTKELLGLDLGGRLELVDLLIADEDNVPARTSDLPAWRARIDAPQKLAIDPTHHFGELHAAAARLPLIVLIDTKTMVAVDALDDPDPDLLEQRIRDTFARLDGTVKPEAKTPSTVDDRFSREQWDLISAMTLPGAPPPDATNAKADDPAAAVLGKQFFSEKAFSPGGKVSCGSCHDATKQLNDGLPRSTAGVVTVDRNSPAIALAAHSRWQFWDGRADSLWVQALGPLENEKEFNSTRLFVDHVVFDRYKAAYEAVWGAMPELTDAARFPPSAKPGSPEWGTMTAADQQVATRVYVNVGKSIAAFERTFRVEKNALDRYVAGDLSALAPAEKDGLQAFFASGCAQCHYGPRLTDDAFHVLRWPTGRLDGRADRGRIDGIALLLSAEVSTATAWSDAPPDARIAALVPASATMGAFKTPTLRGLPGSAPYGHGGTMATLDDVLAGHGAGALDPSSSLAVGTREPWLSEVEPARRPAMLAFLARLTAVPVVP